MNTPLVSLCILTYQAESYITDCLNGILSQTYTNFELLILDDASTDKTVAIIDRYRPALCKKCRRVEVIRHNSNSGSISRNLNELLAHCEGVYCKTLAGDDVLCPNGLEEMTAYLESNRNCVLVYSNGYIIQDSWHWGDHVPAESFHRKHKPPVFECTFEKLLFGNYIPAPTVMIRRTVYETYGYHDENIIAEDYEMWLRLARYERFGYINKKLVYYRKSETGISRSNSRKKFIGSYNRRVQVINKYLPYCAPNKRSLVIESHLLHLMSVAKRQKYYDLLLILWIKKELIKARFQWKNRVRNKKIYEDRILQK